MTRIMPKHLAPERRQDWTEVVNYSGSYYQILVNQRVVTNVFTLAIKKTFGNVLNSYNT